MSPFRQKRVTIEAMSRHRSWKLTEILGNAEVRDHRRDMPCRCQSGQSAGVVVCAITTAWGYAIAKDLTT